MLEVKPLAVCEITAILGLATSTVSKHLSILRDAGLIIDEKDGKWVNYKLSKGARNWFSNQLLGLLSEHLGEDETIQEDAKKAHLVDRFVICKR
ncbi:MAG: ArsR/SmtB family transcription factor [Bacteroidota bacterium]